MYIPTGETPGRTIRLEYSEYSRVKLNKHVTQTELCKELNKTVRTIERNMKTLQEAKVIARIGSDTTGHWVILK